MTTMVCIPDYYIAILVILGFAIALGFESLGRWIKEKYGWPAE